MPDFPGTLKPPRLASAPASPALGQMFYNTATNKLQWWNGSAWVNAEGGTGLPADTVVAAGTRIISNKLLAGDAQPNWRLDGNGMIQWGAGGATALDANLYRSAAGQLKTDGQFRAGTDLVSLAGDVWARFGDANTQVKVGNDGSGRAGLIFGGAADANLYRAAPNDLRTGGKFVAATSLEAATEVVARLGSGTQMTMGYVSGYAGLFFGSAADTNLYRSAANVLKTDDAFQAADYLTAGNYIFAHYGSANQVVLGHDGTSAAAGMYFGSSADTFIRRVGAQAIQIGGVPHGPLIGLSPPPSELLTGFNIAVMISGVTTYREIAVGAPDSGGAGYRMLRVPN